MKKIFLILALSFAFLPLFAGEKFLAKYYKVKTTNNPPYTYEFCTIQTLTPRPKTFSKPLQE